VKRREIVLVVCLVTCGALALLGYLYSRPRKVVLDPDSAHADTPIVMLLLHRANDPWTATAGTRSFRLRFGSQGGGWFAVHDDRGVEVYVLERNVVLERTTDVIEGEFEDRARLILGLSPDSVSLSGSYSRGEISLDLTGRPPAWDPGETIRFRPEPFDPPTDPDQIKLADAMRRRRALPN